MAGAGLKHWMLHNDQLATELDETLKLSPGYDPVRDVDPALAFHAPLLTGPDSIPGAIRAIVERNSESTYQAPRGAFLLSALDDESRHEYTPNDEPLGVLMEPASTNKCINHNADAQAENMFLGGDPLATLTYVNDAEELNRAGLDRVAGKVYRLNNSAGTEFARANPLGECENTNPHTVRAYWRGTGQGEIRLSGSGAGPESVPTHYELETNLLTPTSPTNGLEVRAQPGADIYFILNQLEEKPVPTSVIVTEGAATSRAVDQLSWPLAGEPKGPEEGDPFVNDPDGWQVDPEIVVTKGAVTASNTTADRSAAYDNNNIPVDTDKFYEVTYTIESMNGGSVRSLILDEDAAYGLSAWRSEPGTYTDILTPTIPGGGGYRSTIAVQFSNGMVQGVVSDLRCRELTSILNQAEGMAAVRVTFGWSFDNTVVGQQQSFITFRAGEVSLLYHNNSGGTSQLVSRDDAATFAVAVFPPGKPEKNEHYLLLVRWGNGTFQVGFKIGGAVTWGATESYVGRFDEEGEMHFSYISKLPLHGRDLYLWSEDRGTAWLESFFEGVAN